MSDDLQNHDKFPSIFNFIDPLFQPLLKKIWTNLNFLIKFHVFPDKVKQDKAKVFRQMLTGKLVQNGMEEKFLLFH